MGTDGSFEEVSYQKHSEFYRDFSSKGDKAATAASWLSPDTVDAFRHIRMYEGLDPLLSHYSSARWLTVGDGRYGRDAKYILEKGGKVLATDLSEYLLKEAKVSGYISDYQVENAECLSFGDEEYDFVYCKESYHHFPRPMLALYEMLRVAKEGVVLTEPSDPFIGGNPIRIFLQKLKAITSKLRGREFPMHSFEAAGNYKYCISRREMEKVALGVNLHCVAFRGNSDFYEPGMEMEKLVKKGPLFKKFRQKTGRADLMVKWGLTEFAILTCILFKKDPSPELEEGLRASGYDVIHLPRNPYA